MNQGTTLLRAILDDPGDDLPRLAYADWLEEDGDPLRAEFIRLQIDLARDRVDSLARREKAWRARQLLEGHQEQWLDCVGHGFDEQLRRGFVEKLGLMSWDLETYGEDFFSAFPLRHLWLTDTEGDPDCVGLIPSGNHLSTLDLCGNFRVAGEFLEALADSSHLRELRVLDLTLNEIDDESAQLLRERPFFQGLALIRLGGNPLSEEGRRLLTEHFAERVSFVCERDEGHLYTIKDDYLRVGFGREHTQLLMLAGPERQRVAVFDHEGNLLRTEVRSVDQSGVWTRQEREENREKARDEWLQELGYESATIAVKRFRFTDGGGIYDFPDHFVEPFEHPGDPERDDWRRRVDRWLYDGQFRFQYGGAGGDVWLNGEGEVTDT